MEKRTLFAVLAGMMFALAGTIELTAAFVSRRPMNAAPLSVGVMFLCVGALWLAIGMRWKKQDATKS